MSDRREPDRILIIDDSPDTLRFLASALEQIDAEVLLAINGTAALKILEKSLPDLILMDALMPGLDGFELTRIIKQDPRTAPIPIIFMTGLTETEHAIRALELGGTDYVRKPLDVDELLARLGVHLANAHAARRSTMALALLRQPLLTVDRQANIRWATPEAHSFLASFQEASGSARLPGFLANAVVRLREAEAPVGLTMRVEIDAGAIEVTLIEKIGDDEFLLKLGDFREEALITQLQEGNGLTRREAEVLLWISYGKPNRVISEILSISPRTVNKHLEQVFAKLGVETRAAAAAVAVKSTAR